MTAPKKSTNSQSGFQSALAVAQEAIHMSECARDYLGESRTILNAIKLLAEAEADRASILDLARLGFYLARERFESIEYEIELIVAGNLATVEEANHDSQR